MIAIVDYGMGNRRSVEKALEHVGADAGAHRRPRADPRGGRRRLPGVGAFPEAMRRIRAAGLDELIVERAEAGVPVLGLCLGMQLLFEASDEHEGATGLALLPGRVRPLRGERVPHIGWNLVTFTRAVATAGRARRGGGLLPRALVRRASPRTRRTSSAAASTASAFVSIVERGNVMGVQFHPEKSSRDGLALLRNFARKRRTAGRVILYPAIDIYGGRAVRLVEGRFEDATTYHDDPLEAAQSWVDAGARYLHVVDLDGAKEGEPRSIEHLRRIVQGTGVPVQYGGGLRTVDAVRDALRAGAERAIVGTAAFRDIDFLDEILSAYGPRIVVSVDVRGGHISTAGWTRDHRAARRRRDPAPAGPRRRLVRLHQRRSRRQARGPGRGRGAADRRRGARALPLLGRDRPP